jgi:hypothetical protein
MKIAGSGSIGQRHGSTNPDPYQNVTDPQHCLKKNKKFLFKFFVNGVTTKMLSYIYQINSVSSYYGWYRTVHC